MPGVDSKVLLDFSASQILVVYIFAEVGALCPWAAHSRRSGHGHAYDFSMIWRSWVGRSSDEHGRVTWCLEVQLMKDVIDWSKLSPIVIRATRVLSLLHPSIHPSTDNNCQQHPHRIHCWIREAAIEKYDKLLWLVGAFAFGAEVGSWKGCMNTGTGEGLTWKMS